MATAVKAKVNKPVLYKMISYKGTSGAKKYTPITAANRLGTVEKSIGVGFSSVIAGLNSLGATLNSIAAATQNLLEAWKTAISTQISDNQKLIKQEEKTKKEDVKRANKKDKAQKDRRALENREKSTEDTKLFRSRLALPDNTEKGMKKPKTFMDWVKSILGDLLGIMIFKWIAENPKAVEKFVKFLAAIGKFVFKTITWLTGIALDGLFAFLENPLSLKGFFGIFKFLIGAVPLFAGFMFLKNPLGTIKIIGKVISGVLGGIKNLFGMVKSGDLFKKFKIKEILGKGGKFFSSKVGKLALGIGTGVTAATSVLAAGGSGSEAVGAGVGATGGQMAGAALGAATGIPGAGVVLGAVGGMAGGKIGQAVGGMIEPIIKPIGDFFKQIGTIFNNVVGEIKKPLEEFFKTLGAFLSGILKVVEPHLPLISKILSIGLQVMFAPLFLGIRALTAVLKLFVGDKDKKDDKKISPAPTQDKQPTKGTETKTLKSETKGGVRFNQKTGKREYYGDYTPEKETDVRIAKIRMRMHPGMSKEEIKRYEEQIAYLNKHRSTGGYDMSGKSNKKTNKAFGNFAAGGWIKGPQSGYPVSLNGGKSTSFIGHGTEWVGRKEGGRAFVVPFDTPSTRGNPGLTRRRIGEASRQGYSLPKAFDQALRPYDKGGSVYTPKPYKVGSVYTPKSYKGGGEVVKPKHPISRWLAKLGGSLTRPKPQEKDISESKTISTSQELSTHYDKETGKAYVNGKEVDLKKYAEYKLLSKDEQLDQSSSFFDETQVQPVEDKKPEGLMRWVAGYADMLTMNKFDLDKRGTILDGATRLKDNIGQTLEDAKQRMTETRVTKINQDPIIMNVDETNPAVVTEEQGEDAYVIVPGKEELDADKYIKPKYGLIAEFLTDPVEFM